MNKKVINFNEFKHSVSKICRNLGGWKPDYVVGITRGGLFPAVMISHWLNVPMHSLGVSLRDNTDNGTESNMWMAEDAYDGKNILVVDDINDSGATLNWIMNDWASSCFPNCPKWDNVWNNNVRFAVVVDNLASDCTVKMDYCGFEVNKAEEDVWIEFPYEEWWTK